MSLLPKIFLGGQLLIEARRLEDDADLSAHFLAPIRARSRPNIFTVDGGAAMSVQRMRKELVFPLPLGPRNPKISPRSP